MTEIDEQRRQTLKGIVTIGSTLIINPGVAVAANSDVTSWQEIRAAYPKQTPFMNLDNAALSPATHGVQRESIDAFKFANLNPSHNMWNVLDSSIPATKLKLARMADCDPGEIAINRNTTEGMTTAILGMPLSRGDEVLISSWDYPAMINAWEQRSLREGIVIKRVAFDLMDSDEVVVAAFANSITPRTRAIQLTHMIHWTGRVIPVADICRIARGKDILTVVDAAQSFAHIPLSFRDIGCDYLATSLHKWLCAPFGTGMLIVKSSRIRDTWPLIPVFEELDGADKFGMANLGTYDSAAQYAVGPAIAFHNSIGTERIHERLRDLSRYWVKQASGIRDFKIHTPMDSPNLGAVTLFSLRGKSVKSIEDRLRDEYKIQTRHRSPVGLSGVRVSPHLYTRKSDLDRFVDALKAIATSA